MLVVAVDGDNQRQDSSIAGELRAENLAGAFLGQRTVPTPRAAIPPQGFAAGTCGGRSASR